jgi:hypothetical protein
LRIGPHRDLFSVNIRGVLRRIFGPKRDNITEEWRKLHNEELYALYSAPSINRALKSRILRWACYIARMGREEVHTGLCWENLREEDHMEHPSLDKRIILKSIFEKLDGSMD